MGTSLQHHLFNQSFFLYWLAKKIPPEPEHLLIYVGGYIEAGGKRSTLRDDK